MKELISYKEALKTALVVTNEGMHFKGQYLSKENYSILGNKVKVIELAFRFVYWIEFKGERYFISEDLFKKLDYEKI